MTTPFTALEGERLGPLLRRRLYELGKTCLDLATALDVHRITVDRYINGKTIPNSKNLIQAALFLEVPEEAISAAVREEQAARRESFMKPFVPLEGERLAPLLRRRIRETGKTRLDVCAETGIGSVVNFGRYLNKGQIPRDSTCKKLAEVLLIPEEEIFTAINETLAAKPHLMGYKWLPCGRCGENSYEPGASHLCSACRKSWGYCSYLDHEGERVLPKNQMHDGGKGSSSWCVTCRKSYRKSRRGQPRTGKKRGIAAQKPCGTRTAYFRHLEYGEEPCEACKSAARISDRLYRHPDADPEKTTRKVGISGYRGVFPQSGRWGARIVRGGGAKKKQEILWSAYGFRTPEEAFEAREKEISILIKEGRYSMRGKMIDESPALSQPSPSE